MFIGSEREDPPPFRGRDESAVPCSELGKWRHRLIAYDLYAILSNMERKKAYKYRFYPTEEQKHILARTFGCCRYVYNWALRERTDAYYQHGERLSYEGTAQRLTALKKKRNDQAATYAASAFKWDGKQLTLARMDEPLKIVWSRCLPDGCQPSTVTIIKDTANRYFVSLLIEEDIKPLPITSQMIGLDLGIKSMVVTSDGHQHGNPRFFAKDEKILARAQRRHARKKKGSKNREKARCKVARIHARIRDRRRDYQHKLSTQIIRENQVVCVESLGVKNMVKNHKLAKAISDVGWGEFVRQLEYKANWYGRTLVKVDKFYPSSKHCSACGHILDALALDIRVWTCPECGVIHDRDSNAARNVLAAGLAVHACGEMVRPGAAKANAGTSR